MDTREKFHPTIIKVTTEQLNGRSNYHVFNDIKLFAYIRPVQCPVQILHVRKTPAKGFGLVIIKPPKTNIIIPLWTSYYIPQNPKNTVSQTELKHYNEFRNVKTEALRWVKMTTCTGIKLLDFITIDIIKLEQQHHSSYDIIPLPINPIINSSFNKHLMS